MRRWVFVEINAKINISTGNVKWSIVSSQMEQKYEDINHQKLFSAGFFLVSTEFAVRMWNACRMEGKGPEARIIQRRQAGCFHQLNGRILFRRENELVFEHIFQFSDRIFLIPISEMKYFGEENSNKKMFLIVQIRNDRLNIKKRIEITSMRAVIFRRNWIDATKAPII